MSNYTLEAFKAEHVLEARYRDPESAVGIVDIAPKYERWPSFTGRFNGEIIGAGGIVVVSPGVGEVWAFATMLADQHRVFFHRTFTRLHRSIIENLGLHRLQAVVYESNTRGRKWAEAFGLTSEATLHRYGAHGEDVIVYVRFFAGAT